MYDFDWPSAVSALTTPHDARSGVRRATGNALARLRQYVQRVAVTRNEVLSNEWFRVNQPTYWPVS